MRTQNFVLYGFGAIGKSIADILLDDGIHVAAILDQNKSGTSYRGVSILDLSKARSIQNISEQTCLITLHNHYIDLKPIYESLTAVGFKKN